MEFSFAKLSKIGIDEETTSTRTEIPRPSDSYALILCVREERTKIVREANDRITTSENSENLKT